MTSKIVWHRHHLVPKHAGGGDDKENLIKVNVAMHAFLHEQLYKEFGRKQDYYAWKGLSGAMGKDEIIAGLISHPGKSNPFYGKKHTQETKDKISNNKERALKISENNGMKNPRHRKKQNERIKEKLAKVFIAVKDGMSKECKGVKEVSELTGLSVSVIRNSLSGVGANTKGWSVLRK